MSDWFRAYGFAEVLEGFLVGAYPLDAEDVAVLEWMGIESVMNLVKDGEYRPGDRERVSAALARAGIEERRLDLVDYGGLPPGVLEQAVREINAWLDEGRRTYLHCRAGWQRSAAIAAGVVATRGGLDIDRAVEFVRSRKPTAAPLPHQREDLRRWWGARTTHARDAPGPPAESDRRIETRVTPPPAADGR